MLSKPLVTESGLLPSAGNRQRPPATDPTHNVPSGSSTRLLTAPRATRFVVGILMPSLYFSTAPRIVPIHNPPSRASSRAVTAEFLSHRFVSPVRLVAN